MATRSDINFLISAKRYQDSFAQTDAIRKYFKNSDQVASYVGRDNRSGQRILATPDGSNSFSRYDSNASLKTGSAVSYAQISNSIGSSGTIDTKPS